MTGIQIILDRTPSEQKAAFIRAILGSIGRCELAEAGKADAALADIATNWLGTAISILTFLNDAAMVLSVPGSPKFKLEVLQQLVANPNADHLQKQFKPLATAAELQAAFVNHVSEGRSIRNPRKIVTFLKEQMGPTVSWPEIIGKVGDRLRTPITVAAEIEALLRLILAIRALVESDAATALLKELSVQGYLPHYFSEFNTSSTRAPLIATTLLANPGYERAAEFQNSTQGDALYKELMAQADPSADIVEATAKVFQENDVRGALLETAATQGSVQPFATAVMSAILNDAKDTVGIVLTGERSLALANYLFARRDKLPTAKLLSRVHEPQAQIHSFTQKPFDINFSFIYSAALELPEATADPAFVTYLSDGVAALPASIWDQALTEAPGGSANALTLAQIIRVVSPDFALKIVTSDSILGMVRKVGEGSVALSDQLNTNVANAMALLEPGIRDSLRQNILDDMDNKAGSYITAVLSVLKSDVHLDAQANHDRIVRRVFSPIVLDPTIISVDWMNREIAVSEIVKHLSSGTLSDIDSRLTSAVRKDGLPAEMLTALTATRTLLGLQDVEDATKSDTTSSQTKS